MIQCDSLACRFFFFFFVLLLLDRVSLVKAAGIYILNCAIKKLLRFDISHKYEQLNII